MPPQLDPQTAHTSTVYGPVKSWRVGQSLGIDLLLKNSICSFNCIYCQLGEIQVKTAERQIYVSTEQVERDLRRSDWEKADIITFSGNGEPTLALNLAEVIHLVKEYTHKPVMVLTNGTLLNNPQVQADLMEADQVAVKLDAATDEGLKRMNRPVAGITLEGIVSGAEAFAKQYQGKLSLQCMFMPVNLKEAEAMADLIKRINPVEVQLNTPKRPYPLEWHVESRGNHDKVEFPSQMLKTLSEDQALDLETFLAERTGIPIVSIYRKATPA
jgi:wyosine [tRNA(Phe)-imidazoG37] synthetase (radical SAM superfamily)